MMTSRFIFFLFRKGEGRTSRIVDDCVMLRIPSSCLSSIYNFQYKSVIRDFSTAQDASEIVKDELPELLDPIMEDLELHISAKQHVSCLDQFSCYGQASRLQISQIARNSGMF